MVSGFLSALVAVQSRFGDWLLVLIVALTAGLAAYAGAAFFGWVPHPSIGLTVDGQPVDGGGLYLTVAVVFALLALCLFLPANFRMLRLERSHRAFALSMEDIARAYRIVHASDRRGVFTIAGEFEAMKERMDHLRRHPDLAHLEPELLQVAAQMSLESRELARLYSTERVERARTFLRQRQEEVEAFADRIKLARATCDELRRWLTDIEAEEHQSQVQIRRLEADLKEILPLLGYDFDDNRNDRNVVALPKPPK